MSRDKINIEKPNILPPHMHVPLKRTTLRMASRIGNFEYQQFGHREDLDQDRVDFVQLRNGLWPQLGYAAAAVKRSAVGFGTEQLHAVRAAALTPLEILDTVHAVAIFAWANRLMLNLGEPVFPPGDRAADSLPA